MRGTTRWSLLLALVLAFGLAVAASGGDDDDDAAGGETAADSAMTDTGETALTKLIGLMRANNPYMKIVVA
jgi:hypothetical protein